MQEDVESAKSGFALLTEEDAANVSWNDKNVQIVLDSNRLSWSERHSSFRASSELFLPILPYTNEGTCLYLYEGILEDTEALLLF